jgi:hypothetical protein
MSTGHPSQALNNYHRHHFSNSFSSRGLSFGVGNERKSEPENEKAASSRLTSFPFCCVSDFSMRWTRGEPSAVRRKLLSPFRSPSLRHYGIAGSYFYSYKFMFVDWS